MLPWEVIEESRPTWVNITYMKHYYKTRDLFVWNSERDGHSHLYLYKTDGTMTHQITSGPWQVTSLDAVDEKRGHIYFTANKNSVIERHVYRVGEKGGRVRQLSKRDGTHSATFSPNHRYYVDRFSNVTTPTEISVHDATGKEIYEEIILVEKEEDKEEYLNQPGGITAVTVGKDGYLYVATTDKIMRVSKKE